MEIMKWAREGVQSWLRKRRTKVVDVPFPQIANPYEKKPKRSHQGRPRLGRPERHPGTITFHDWLVRHYGYNRRMADAVQKHWRETGEELWRR